MENELPKRCKYLPVRLQVTNQYNQPQISVVIATYNRADVLRVTLDKLAKQSLSSKLFEVIVVDDGSSDRTDTMMKSLVGTMPYCLKFFRHENRGPGYTENRGIKIAQSDLILLIADDIWPFPSLLEEHLKIHKEHPEDYFAVLGKVQQSPQLPSTVIQNNWDPFLYNRFEGLKEVESIYFYACNISVKKKFLLENGMFKERKGAAHEDAELGYRLGQKGLQILYNGHAMADHHHEETLERMCKRAYERGKNFDMLSDNVLKSYVFPIYKIASLEAGWKVFLKMLPRELLRLFFFNYSTVTFLWLPVLAHADESKLAELLAFPLIYRGVNGYFLRKGYKDLRLQANLSSAKQN